MFVAAVAVALAVRGALRGLVREAVEIGVLLVGMLLVFRLSPVLGSIIAGMANVPFEVARIVAGAVLFVGLVVGGALGARVLSVALKVVPGATMLNRLGGALVGTGYAALVVILATTMVSVVPVSDGVREAADGLVTASSIGRQIVDPSGSIQRVTASVSGESVFSTVLAIQDAVGSRLIAGTLPIPLPDVGDSLLLPSQIAAQQVFDSLNRTRVAEGLDPLGWSGDLAVVAVTRATSVYGSRLLALDDNLAASLSAQDIPGTINTEMVVLAASPEGIAEAFVSTPSYNAALLDVTYRKAGVGVIDGPFGLIAVQVLSG